MTVTAEPSRLATSDAAPARATANRQRWALLVLLGGTAVLYLWDLNRSGWANSFYSAAAQAGSQSWKAFLFGSSDAANSITVDKPPLSLWPSALAIRIFGLNSWSIVVPQALLGVGSVAVLWDAVRRRFGETAGLVAGLVLAVTPVAVSIFRYNNPDALLVLLMLAAVWALLRAVDDGRLRWLLLCGGCLGLGYLAKQLEVALVMPALGVTYLLAGPKGLLNRAGHLAVTGLAAVVGAGWWILLVHLWPAGQRPWIGGTQHNSILELTLGYNGLGRLDGNEPGSTGFVSANAAGAAKGPAHPWGQPGIGRLFEPEQAGGIGWLLPAALIFAVALVIWRSRAPRRDLERAAILVWVLWLLTTGLVFSFMAGIFHSYYTVALAPSIAAVVGIGVTVCWRHREMRWAQATLAVAVVVTAVTAVLVLRRSADFHPWLRWLVPVAGVGLVVYVARLGSQWAERPVVHRAMVLAAIVLALSGPIAFSLATVVRGNSGALPVAGPLPRVVTATSGSGSTVQRAVIKSASGPGFLLPSAAPGGGRMAGCTLLESGVPDKQMVDLLDADAASYAWVGATVGSVCASGYQLASGHPVMPVGGFNGTDPAPTPDEFVRLVHDRRIHYFIVTNPVHEDKLGHLDAGALIQQWVQRNFTPAYVGRLMVYDLTR